MLLIQFAIAGFGLAALGYLVLAVLLALRGVPQGPGRLFLAAVVIEAVWAGVIAAAMARPAVPATIVSRMITRSRNSEWFFT